jgi:hypothetical protein
MQKLRRKAWIGVGMGAFVAVSLAATLGLSNANTIGQQPPAMSQVGLSDQQQSSAMNAARQAMEAAQEAMEVGDNIADGCEDVGTPQADAATAQGVQAKQAGATARQALRQVVSLIRSGQMTQDMTQLLQAVSAAEAAMADARQSVVLAQTAVAQNPDARRSSQRMLNGAAADIDSGARAMQSAQNFLARASNGR